MEKIILKGRPTYNGIAEGPALVCPDSIAGNTGGLDDTNGIIHERGNSNRGVCIKDTILVLPCSKGSNGFSIHFKAAKLNGFSPAGWIITKMDARIGVAVVSLGVPAVSDFEGDDPVKIIKTGDWVRIDGTTGIVEITRN